MNRIYAINMPKSSPMGEMSIAKDLHKTDVILVQGRNGSGKTSIADALCKPGSGVECRDVHGNPAEIPVSRLSQSLLIRRGSELMAGFKSLEDALAKASGVGRVREFGMLLDKLLEQRRNARWSLDKLVPSIGDETPPGVDRRVDDMLGAESRLWSDHLELARCRPLTIGTYVTLARDLARRLGRAEPDLSEAVDERAMRRVESDLSPEHRYDPGKEELRGFLHEVIRHGSTTRLLSLGERLDQLLEGSESSAAVNHVRKLEDLDPGHGLARWPDGPSPWEKAIENEIRECELEDKQIIAELESIDVLRALRKQACDWLETRREPSQECPVCGQGVDTDALIRGLAELPVDSGSRVERLAKSREELTRRLGDLQAVKKRVATLSEDWSENLAAAAEWRRCLGSFLGGLRPSDDWDAGVATTARNLQSASQDLIRFDEANDRGCELASFEFWVDKVRRLVSDMTTCLNDLKQERDRLNNNLAPARGLHGLMCALRELLVSRDTLNKLDWKTTWAKEEAARNTRDSIRAWKSAAEELRKEFHDEERRMQDKVLHSDQTRQRFSKLVGRIDHPLIRNQGLGADWKALSPQLSEGYRVLVNLAAFIAVAGYTCDGQSHAAGWVVLDEPTNGLDPEHQIQVARYLGELGTALMPRQMFVMSFEDEFGRELMKSASDSGCRCAEIRLSDWSDVPVAPSVIRH